MTTSQNGWIAADDYSPAQRAKAGIVSLPILPGSDEHVALNAAAAPVLLYVAARWDAEVERIVGPVVDDWGFAPRLVRGSSTEVSNHASGTALDIDAQKHPRGKRTMGARKRAAVHKILADVNADKPILDWGGDYTRSPLDEMHVELVYGVTRADLLATMKRLTGHRRPAPKPPTLWMGGPKRPLWTRTLQTKLGLKADGVYGRDTRAAVRALRRKKGLRPFSLGVAGPKVWHALGIK